MNFAKFILIFILLGAAFVAGYWPEHVKRARAERDLRDVDRELVETRGQLRLARLHRYLHQAILQLEDKDYEGAERSLDEFFSAIRVEMARPDMLPFRPALEKILSDGEPIRHSLHAQEVDTRELRVKIAGLLNQVLESRERAELPPVLPRPPVTKTD